MRHSAISPLLALAALLVIAPVASASFTSNLTNGNIAMTGNGASDFIRIERSGALLVHDRFSAGDPGFASSSDWDTSTGGSQQLNASSLAFVSVNAGAGTDVVILGGDGDPASALIQDFNVDGGGGTDAILVDSTDDTAARTATFASNLGTGTVAITGNGGTLNLAHGETDGVVMRFGSGSDTASVGNTEPTGPLVIEGLGGNDTANVALTGLEGTVEFDGGPGTTDTLNVNGASSSSSYLVGQDSVNRAGSSAVNTDSTLERLNLNAGGQADMVFKSGSRPVTINAGGGDDLLATRDSVGDTANCGSGSDYVLTDSLDTLSECESSDRTAPAQQPPADGGSGGTDMTTMTTMMMSMMPTGEMADRTSPTAGISGVKGSIRLKTFLKGLKGKLVADEASSYEVQLLGSTNSARLARTYNLTLAKQNLALDSGIRDIKLKPNKRLIGRAKKFSVRVVVTPTDAAGNRGKPVTKTLKVKR